MKKVVIIDDEEDFLKEISEILISHGYEAKPFFSPEQAIKKIKIIQPDIILLDFKMEEMSGFEIAEKLSNDKETAHIPIIGITGFYTEREYHLPIKMCGIKKYLLKPVEPQELISEIEKLSKK
ncbi:MAG: response regulator [Candidatus Omnitrophota bacterium]